MYHVEYDALIDLFENPKSPTFRPVRRLENGGVNLRIFTKGGVNLTRKF